MEQINATLTGQQVWSLQPDLLNHIKADLQTSNPEINKYELDEFIRKVVGVRIAAILCTLTSDSYENIIKVVHDKLNLNDLFDNRQKYLN